MSVPIQTIFKEQDDFTTKDHLRLTTYLRKRTPQSDDEPNEYDLYSFNQLMIIHQVLTWYIRNETISAECV